MKKNLTIYAGLIAMLLICSTSVVYAAGEVAYWNFNEGTGTVASDSTGNGNNLNLINNPSWLTSGKVGKAISFDGVNDYATRSTASGIPSTGPLSLTIWINPKSTTTPWKDIFRKQGSWSLQLNPSGTINLEVTGKKDVNSGIAPPLDAWTHVALTYDSGTVKFYENGALVNTLTGIPSPDTGSSSIYIGGYDVWSTYYKGHIDEFKIYSRILSDSEVQAEYNGGSGTPDTVPPSEISDLSAGSQTSDSIRLTWTAPGDDGNSGTASGYDIRYSTSAITASNWNSATQAVGEPTPGASGSSETFTIYGLSPEMTYYFAIKTTDEVPNWSGLSNVASATTTSGSTNTNWYNPSWAYRKSIRIDGSTAGAQANYPVRVPATFVSGRMKNDFSDIRLTSSDGTTLLSHWKESYTSSSSAVFWVNMPSIPSGGTDIYMYYGNPSAGSASNGPATFESFDDFSSFNLNTNPVLSPTYSWENPKLRWGSIAYLNGNYYIYYTSGSSSTSDIGRAKSSDLVTWTKNTGNPVISDRIGPSILKELDGTTPVYYNSKYWMLTMTAGGTAIELRSAPGIDSNTWTLENSNLITPAAGTWYSSKVYTTSFVREGNTYYIFLEGSNAAGQWQVGYFTASSPSGPYTNKGVLLSPDLSWEGTGILDPEMRKFDGEYYLFYTGNTDASTYRNSYAKASSITGPYTKSNIQITPTSHTYPAILKKGSYYYILTDNQNTAGKDLFMRSDLAGMFEPAFSWGSGGSGSLTVSNGILSLTGPRYISGLKDYPVGFALRTRARMDYTSTYKWLGFEDAGKSGSSSDKNLDIFKTNAVGGNTYTTESDGTLSTDTNLGSQYSGYRIWDIARTGAATGFSVDNVLKRDGTSHVSTGKRHPVFNTYTTSSTLDVDWTLIRRYSYPEPSFGTTGPEEQYSSGSDNTPPATITNLAAGSPASNSVRLTWTAPGDDGNTGTASLYDIRYSTSPITSSSWASATQATGEPSPSSAGSSETFTISNLNPSTTYHFAIKTADEVPSWSGLSNIASATTTASGNPTPISYWNFDDGSGTIASDSGSNGNNLNLINNPSWLTSGKVGKAISFDGVNDYASKTSATGLPAGGQFSLTMWTNMKSSNYKWRDFFRKQGSWALQLTPSNNLNFEVTGLQDATSNIVLTENQWTHLAITYDSGTLKYYRNGALVQTKTGVSSPAAGSNSIYVGGYSTWSTYYNGYIDELKIYSSVLSSDEILAEFNR